VDRGQWSNARNAATQAIAVATKDDAFVDAASWRLWSANLDAITGDLRADTLREELKWIDAHHAEIDKVIAVSQDFRVAIGYLAARAGHRDVLDAAVKSIAQPDARAARPMSWQGYQVLLAEQSRLAGKPEAAIERLTSIAAKPDGLAIVHSSLARAYAAAKRPAQARREVDWLATHRGRVFVERGTTDLLQPITIADTTLALLDAAEWSKALGDERRAKDAESQFARAWPVADLPRPLKKRVETL